MLFSLLSSCKRVPVLLASTLLASWLAACGDETPPQPRHEEKEPDAGAEDPAPIASGVDVQTDKGTVHGRIDGNVRLFMGIPYAAPPVTENRWRAPQPMAAWDGTRDALQARSVCPQTDAVTGVYSGNEDCLYLNVYAPEPAPKKPLPVMVWIHGGAYMFGSGSESVYKANHLVEKGDVVIVSINYRLGALGFLAHSALSASDSEHVSGNYGLLDQRAALNWVQKNIATFGGDVDNVTLFGESSGGKSICWHMVTPESHGLFHKAIIQSGYCSTNVFTLPFAEMQGKRLADKLDCSEVADPLACLRDAPAAAVVAASKIDSTVPGGLFYQPPAANFFFEPIVDGKILTEQVYGAFKNGRAANIPVLHGANTSEGALFHLDGIGGVKAVTSAAEYRTALANLFGDEQTDAITAKYPVTDYPTPNDAISAVTGDAIFACSARALARLMTAASIENHLYTFDTALSGVPLPSLTGKAFHSGELQFVFGTSALLGRLSEREQPVADAIQDYWLQFARTGDPNLAGAVTWPAYSAEQDESLRFAMPIEMMVAKAKERCDFWDSIYATLKDPRVER